MRIAIVGPSFGRVALQEQLMTGAALQGIAAEICAYADLPALLEERIEWDLLLLYTENAYYEMACEYRRGRENGALVLWSADDQWSRQSFLLRPQAYLIWPIQQEALRRAFYQCRQWLLPHMPHLTCSGREKGRSILLAEIQYFESFGHTCLLHCGQDESKLSVSLRSLEEQTGGLFVRCHRSYLVNLFWIECAEDECIRLRSGVELPVGERQREKLLSAWNMFRQQCHPLNGCGGKSAEEPPAKGENG